LVLVMVCLAVVSCKKEGCTDSNAVNHDSNANQDDGSCQYLPSVSTAPIIYDSLSIAQTGGTITSDGGSAVTVRGICWDTTPNPTINNDTTINGDGTGNFTSNINNIVSDKTYYVRAYAINANGTGYGNELSFTTSSTGGGGTGTYPPGTVHCNGTPTAVVDVTNPTTGKTWMDRNLGATQAATSSTDADSYGDLYQWGRGADGHQCRNSNTTTTLSSTDQPGHGDFILGPNLPHDWRSSQNDSLWQGVNGINNPCPSGYRLPTDAELDAERLSWSSNNAAGAFTSTLKLPMAGGRGSNNGSLVGVGAHGYCWSSSVSGYYTPSFRFSSSDAGLYGGNRAYGLPVRCIKDY
jgi:hypothetical protein